MVFPNIDPYAFGLHFQFDAIGRHWDLGIRWYALAYVAGILLGWRYILGLVKNASLWGGRPATLSSPQVDDLVLWVTIGVIVGGRLGSVLFYNTEILAHPSQWLEILQVWKGGMSFHGGVIGVALAMILFSRSSKVSLLGVADLVACAQPIGQFFGRIANFINGELWGRQTDLPWGMVFCNERLAYSDGSCPAGDLPRHPSQLYEAALEGAVLFAILRYASHKLNWLQRPGAITGLFLVLYAVFRSLLEFVREPDYNRADLPLGLTMGMILSLPMALGGAWLLWRALKAPALASVPEPAPAPAAKKPPVSKAPASKAKRAAKPKA